MLVAQGKTAKDVWGGKLGLEEAQVLNASLVDYLIHGPQISRYFSMLLSSMGAETPFEDALKNAKLPADAVDQSWRAWTRNPR
jgi:hypothetical protein